MNNNDIFGYDQMKTVLDDNVQEQFNMQYVAHEKQKVQKLEKRLEPSLSNFIREKAKKALPLILAGAIMVGLGASFGAAVPNEPLQVDQESNVMTQQEMQAAIEEEQERERAERTDYYAEYSQDGSGDMTVHQVTGSGERKKVISIQSNEETYSDDNSKGVRNNG